MFGGRSCSNLLASAVILLEIVYGGFGTCGHPCPVRPFKKKKQTQTTLLFKESLWEGALNRSVCSSLKALKRKKVPMVATSVVDFIGFPAASCQTTSIMQKTCIGPNGGSVKDKGLLPIPAKENPSEALSRIRGRTFRADLAKIIGTLRTTWPLKVFMVHIPYWDYDKK